jgi:PIN domain nuclease of toxin-antitoxin system
VKLLLDTNSFLWWRAGSPKLPAEVGDQIGRPGNEILVSVASLWEIVIKRTLGKLQFLEDFESVLGDEEFDLLNITYAHLRVLSDLPLHHRDPFDRLIISQSLGERIPLVTNDQVFADYGVQVVW